MSSLSNSERRASLTTSYYGYIWCYAREDTAERGDHRGGGFRVSVIFEL